MRTIIIILWLSFINKELFANNDSIFLKQLAVYSKVWGLIKYHDDNIARNRINWDSVFVSNIKDYKSEKTKKEFNDFIIKSLLYSYCVEKSTSINNEIWLNDTSILSSQILNFLKCKIRKKKSLNNQYVQPEAPANNPLFNEKPYPEMVFPEREYRLLAIARYWNIINYFYPYKDLIDSDWNKVLFDFIPIAISCNDSLAYHLMIMSLTAKINDSHAVTYSKVTNNFFNVYSFAPALQVHYSNKNLIISKIFDKTGNYGKIRIGDTILAINGNFNLVKIRDSLGRYISASNNASKNRIINDYILNGKGEQVELTIKNNNQNEILKLKRFPFGKIDRISEDQKRVKINDSVAYINMGYLNINNFDSIANISRRSKFLMIDLRDYAKGTLPLLGKYLLSNKKEFALVKEPDYSSPGSYLYRKPLFAGRKNNEYYKGNVIVIVDEYTQSQNEFIGMMLRKVKNVFFIGSQTSGTNGNISKVVLPGNVITYFSGLGIYNEDKSNVQRIGIKVDLEVKNVQLMDNPEKLFSYYYKYLNEK